MNRPIKKHVLKCWPAYFEQVMIGKKRFEARLNDRDFKEGDYVELREYDPEAKRYTGRRWLGTIGYVLDNPPCGLEKWAGFCVFSIRAESSPEYPKYELLWKALEKIRDLDYRGNRHESSYIAARALEGVEP